MVDTAVTPVGSNVVATVAGQHAAAGTDMSIGYLFFHADLIVQAIILLLLLASLWSWKIMIDKQAELKRILSRARKFEEGFIQHEDLNIWYEKTQKKSDHPLAQVFLAGMSEWVAGTKGGKMLSAEEITRLRERAGQAMTVRRNREIDAMEQGLPFLATVGSTAPFIGLLGTVLGIMNSFQNIAMEKSTNLVVVAPGIAEALFATAVGLFAAIPAVMAYNKLMNEVGRIGGMLEDFCLDLDTRFLRQVGNAAEKGGRMEKADKNDKTERKAS